MKYICQLNAQKAFSGVATRLSYIEDAWCLKVKLEVYNGGNGGLELLERKITMMVEIKRTEVIRGKGFICGN